MKRALCILLAAAMLLGIAGCSNTEKDWQEQYDLGMRYLEDGDYEEAILAFSAAIDIDDSRPEAYMGRAEAYIAIDEPEKALKDYKKAQRIARNDEEYADLAEDLETVIEELEQTIEGTGNGGENAQPGGGETQLTSVETRNSSGVLIDRYVMTYNGSGLLAEVVTETHLETGELLSQYTSRFSYDDAGRLIRATYGDTGEMVCSYDAEGRLLSTSYTDGGWSDTSYEYGEDGRLVRSVSENQVSSSVTEYTCDDRGNVLEEHIVTTHEYGTSEAWVSYTYNELGRLTAKTEVWPEGTHYTAYTYLKGIVVEAMTYDYTPETDYIFRIQDTTGRSLWATSVTEGSYTVDEEKRVTQATGYGYDSNGLTEVTVSFYYGDAAEEPQEQEPQETQEPQVDTPVIDREAMIPALNALLAGVDYDPQVSSVKEWSDDMITETIYAKLLYDDFQYGDSSYLQRMGLEYTGGDDGYVHYDLKKIQELTHDAFGRSFPTAVEKDYMRISGNELLISPAVGGGVQQLLIQDLAAEDGMITAVGIAVVQWHSFREFLGYFRASFRENANSVYGYTLVSLEKTGEAQKFDNLVASASSELKERTVTHYASRLIDGDLGTAWVEAANGVGVHEWVMLETADGSEMALSAIEFSLGYQKSEQLLQRNGWPQKVRIECEGGYQQDVVFTEYTDVVVLDRMVETSWVKITILEAVAGTRYEDTCISELRLRGVRCAASVSESLGGPYEQYKSFFYANYSASDIVYLADVTHDGVDEMLVVNFSDEYHTDVYGHVYTIKNGTVTEIYSNHGSDYHAGGFYAWYLVPVPNSDYCNLATESFGMWQGMGTVTYSEYLLTQTGDEIEVAYLRLDSDEEGNHDEYGAVTEAAWSAYAQELDKELADCYRLYCSASNGSGSKALDTSPASVFAE